MDDVEAYLRVRELSLLDERVRRDRAQVNALLSEDFVEFGSSGRAWSREEIVALLESETFAPMQAEEFKYARLSEDVALVTYRAVRKDSAPNASVSLRSSIWTKKGKEWVLRFHQGTRAA